MGQDTKAWGATPSEHAQRADEKRRLAREKQYEAFIDLLEILDEEVAEGNMADAEETAKAIQDCVRDRLIPLLQEKP